MARRGSGAIFTAFLFVLGKFALGLYLGKSAIGSSYGAAGSLVVLLVWIYWSTNILFFGAEFTQVYARERGSMRVAAAFRPPPSGLKPAATQGGGGIKIMIGTLAGLLLGLIASIAGAVFLAVKSVKKLLRAAVH